jgi:hypothetical protein
MASAKQAVGNVLDAVIASSNAITGTVCLLGKSATYGNNWMDAVLNKQSVSLAVDQAIFEQSYRAIKAQELAQIQKTIQAWASDTATELLYKEALAVVDQAITSVKK